MTRQTNRNGDWQPKTQIFQLLRINTVNAANAEFSTSQTVTDLPTLYFDQIRPPTLMQGVIKRIHVKLTPTNAVTYTLRLWNVPEADDTNAALALLYQSPSGLVGGNTYDFTELNIPMWVLSYGKIWYSLEWSGATGNIYGFIEVTGTTLEGT